MMLKPNFHDSRDIRIKNQRLDIVGGSRGGGLLLDFFAASRKIRRIFIESDQNYEIYRQTFP